MPDAREAVPFVFEIIRGLKEGHLLARQSDGTWIATRVIDLRWIAPLPVEGVLAALDGAGKVLIVDECRRSGNVSEALMALLDERADMPHARLAAEDSFIATGPAYGATLPSVEGIVRAARAACGPDA